MLYIFDMGGVVTSTAVLDEKIARVLGITEAEFKAFYASSSDPNDSSNLFHMCTCGMFDSGEFWEYFARRSKIAVSTDWWRNMFHPILNEKTVKIIRELKEEGNRVICGTNTISGHYATHVERGDYAYFDQTYCSCFIGAAKPDVAFWKIILQAENVNPKDAVFIDDKQENCDAASSLGIHSIKFTSAEELAVQLGVKI